MTRTSAIHKTASTTSADALYSTIAAWEATIDRATNGDEIGVICDDAAYDEEIEILSGTSGTSIIRLTANDGSLVSLIDGGAASNVRGDGSARSGARIHNTAGTTNVVYMRSNYTIIDHLNIIQSAASASDDCIQMFGNTVEFLAVINCNLECTTGANDQDAININDGNMTAILINGCAIFNPPRMGIHYYQDAASGTFDFDSLHVYHCGMYSDIDDDSLAAMIKIAHNSTSSTTTVEAYNNAGGYIENNTGKRVAVFQDGTHTSQQAPDGTVTWNGSHNFEDGEGFATIDGTDNLTDWVSGSDEPSTVDTTQTSGTYWVVNDLTSGTADLTPLDDAAGNAIIAAGAATADLPSTGNATIDSWWETINESGAIDKRGYRFGSGDAGDADAPDIGPYSYEDHTVATDPFIAQGASI